MYPSILGDFQNLNYFKLLEINSKNRAHYSRFVMNSKMFKLIIKVLHEITPKIMLLNVSRFVVPYYVIVIVFIYLLE